jgi:DNA-binding LytR/AlgR family response regulator
MISNPINMVNTPLSGTDFVKNKCLHILRERKKINPDEIVMMQANINYTTIYLQNGEKIMVAKTLKFLETALNNSDFCRIHRKTLINRNHILSYNPKLGEVSLTNNHIAFTSRRRKENFDKILIIN